MRNHKTNLNNYWLDIPLLIMFKNLIPIKLHNFAISIFFLTANGCNLSLRRYKTYLNFGFHFRKTKNKDEICIIRHFCESNILDVLFTIKKISVWNYFSFTLIYGHLQG